MPIQIPVGAEDQFKGIVDLVKMKARIWRDETLGAKFDDVEIPADLLEKAKEYREQMIEAVAESDDVLFEKFVEGKPITERRDLAAGIRKATIAQKIFPVICGSAFKNKGVQNLLDAVVRLPAFAARYSAGRRHSRSTIRKKSMERKRQRRRAVFGAGLQDHDRPVCRPACFFRVYSGKLNAGESVYNVAKGSKERIGRLVRMHANKREEITEILAGDICAAVGLKQVSTGDTICDDEIPVLLESIDFPTPVIQLAIEPKTKADQEKLGMAIQKLAHGRSDASRYRPIPRPARRFLPAWASCTWKSSSTA